MGKRQVVANRVFVGYPWRTYRPFWEHLITDLHGKLPLHFLAVGRESGQPAAELLAKILRSINTSTLAFFDASGGNPNVSLEFGYARSVMGDQEVFLFQDEESLSASGPGSSIISDLAGTIANRYKLGDAALRTAVETIASRHTYVKRYDKFCRQRRYKGGQRKMLIRVLRKLDGHDSLLRRELLDDLVHETRKSEAHIGTYLKALHEGGLITITRGNEYSSRVYVAA